MTLEDFSNLTEMKDGLTSYCRVEELISVMQKDKDSVVKNVTETARQWSSVASTLAATMNRDILDHFVRLDGLLFLDRWLQEAHKLSNDTCDNSVEESISLLLRALKKLSIDKKRSVSSGIGATVEKLFAHKSFTVQERARALFDGWNEERDNDKDQQDTDEVGEFLDDRVKQAGGTVATGCLKHSSFSDTVIERNADGKPIASEHQHSTSSDGFQSKGNRDVNNSVTNIEDDNHTTLNPENKEDGFRENAQGSSFMSNSCQGNISIMEKTSRSPAERMSSIRICSIPASLERRSSDLPKLKDLTNDAKEIDVRTGCPDEIGKKEPLSVSAPSGPESVSYADPADVQQPVMQADVLRNIDAKETEVSTEKVLPAGLDDDTCALATELKSLAVESGTLKHLKSAVELECTDPEASFSGNQDTETADNVEELAGESILKVEKGFETNFAISKPEIHVKVSDINKRSDMEFDYGIDDALEVARQVAIEVEREVVDYREQLYSSSSEKDSGDRAKPRSPDSINDEGDLSVVRPENKMPVRQNLPFRAFPPKLEDHLSDYADKTEDCMHKADSSQAAETFQKFADQTKKGICDFDLNEVCSEEMDHPTITFVSASKVTPAGVPRAPLHFEGELGWKGSAATSAFRPAPVRRTPDGERPLSVEESSQSSKQRQGHLDFDLNVAEDYGDGATHPLLGKQMPVSSDLPSGESSIEVSSRKAQRLKLDLNRVGDNEETPSSDCRMEERFRYHHRNGSPSPASSSSSRQFPMRNIDLNGNPSFFDDSSDQRPGFSKCSSRDMNTSGGFKLDAPVVSILGARVAINRPELIPQTRSFLANGRGVESPISGVFTRAENGLGTHHQLGYTSQPSSLFGGYNGFSMGSSVSLSPAFYGPGPGPVPVPVPCMVDSRGVPVVPQMMPPSSDVTPSQPPPFLMSMSGPFMGLNGVSRPSFDLNSGLTVVEAENREAGGLRQLFFPGPGIFMEEQMRSASQAMGPGVGAKRKEPDGGWDMYPVGYKHQQPWR